MKLIDFKARYSGRCYILGNGPSLQLSMLGKLNGMTFGTNRFYLSGITPDFYVCVNPLVLEQWGKEIEQVKAKAIFLPEWYLSPDPSPEGKGNWCIPINTSQAAPGFYSPEGGLWEGHTVTYVCLQLAYYMGFEEVVLLGVDHDYGEIKQPNQKQRREGADGNHFHPDYFPAGSEWHTPDLARSEIAYSLARQAYEADGRRIVNASQRTALKVFETMPLRHILSEGPRVSAVVSAYKCTGFLDGLFEDLERQTEQPEIVVICRAASEEARICQRWAESGRVQMQLLETPDIPSIYQAWNEAVRTARGKYLISANTDDRLKPETLELMANLLDGRPDIDLIYGDCFVTWDHPLTWDEFAERHNGQQIVMGRQYGRPGFYKRPEHDPQLLSRECYIGPQPMWRMNLHQRFGEFDESYQSAGDYEFWLRCSQGGAQYLYAPFFLGIYCARMEGIELSDQKLNKAESQRARERQAL